MIALEMTPNEVTLAAPKEASVKNRRVGNVERVLGDRVKGRLGLDGPVSADDLRAVLAGIAQSPVPPELLTIAVMEQVIRGERSLPLRVPT